MSSFNNNFANYIDELPFREFTGMHCRYNMNDAVDLLCVDDHKEGLYVVVFIVYLSDGLANFRDLNGFANRKSEYPEIYSNCKLSVYAKEDFLLNKVFLPWCLLTRKGLPKQNHVSGTDDFLKVYDSLSNASPLRKSIDTALDKLKEDPLAGNKVQKGLWPPKYVKKYKINNLFRYPLVEGFRLTYTIVSDKKTTTSVILEALDHDEYDKLFGYKTS